MVNNEIRRIKAKLKLLEEEGASWLIGDVIMWYGQGMICMEDLDVTIKSLKQYYLRELEKLLPPDIQQGKLNL